MYNNGFSADQSFSFWRTFSDSKNYIATQFNFSSTSLMKQILGFQAKVLRAWVSQIIITVLTYVHKIKIPAKYNYEIYAYS